MTHRFNLSIGDYNINELKALLNLHEPYTLEDIVENENELREKLLMDAGVSEEKKREIISFLQKAKDNLIQNSKKKFTSIEEITEGDNPIIQKQQTEIVNKVNTVPRSKIINASENVNTIKKLLSINSIFRTDYSSTKSTDFIYTLPEVLKNVVSVELGSIEIPMTYYHIQRSRGDGCNTISNSHFWFEWDDPKYNAEHRPIRYYIEIESGNYPDGYEMERRINYHMIEAIEGGSTNGLITNRAHPQCIIDSNTQKIMFYIKSVPDLVQTRPFFPPVTGRNFFNIYFDKEKRTTPSTYVNNLPYTLKEDMVELKNNFGIIGSLGWVLGFRKPTYIARPAEDANDAVSEGCYDGWGSKYLFLVINDYNKNTNNFCITSYNKSVARSNILARIPTKGLAHTDFHRGLIIQNNNNNNNDSFKKREYFGPVNINRIEIQLIDEYNRIVDLNYMDFSFSLNITCLYDL